VKLSSNIAFKPEDAVSERTARKIDEMRQKTSKIYAFECTNSACRHVELGFGGQTSTVKLYTKYKDGRLKPLVTEHRRCTRCGAHMIKKNIIKEDEKVE